jgi:phosphatidylinositol 4-kinase
MAIKFPMLAKQCADCLREFLTGPSRLLVRLNKHFGPNEAPAKTTVPQLLVTQSDSAYSVRHYRHQPQSARVPTNMDAARSAFERLRDCAIENLCRALRAQSTLDQNSIPALVSAITTRLFQPDNIRDKDWMLSSRNAILALGHIAVTLRDSGGSGEPGEDNARAVLKFLLQWFDSSAGASSAEGPIYDRLLVDQLGCIVISRAKNDVIYTEVLKKFKEIIKEASQAAVLSGDSSLGGATLSEKANLLQSVDIRSTYSHIFVISYL